MPGYRAAPPRNARTEFPLVDAAGVGRLVTAQRAARTVGLGLDLDLFACLRAGPRTAGEVAAVRGLNRRACAVVLDGLVALGLLVKQSGRYGNSAVASQSLLDDGPRSLARVLRTQAMLGPAWDALATTVATGRPPRDLVTTLQEPAFARAYLDAMAEVARPATAEVAARLAAHRPRRLLDVGAGPAAYTLALLRACPELRATLVDLPAALALTRERLDGHPESGRIAYVAGDYHTVDLGQGDHDLVLFSHTTHNEDARAVRALFRRGWTALRKPGVVAVHDFVVASHRTRPVFPALLAVHLLAYTATGRIHRLQDYTAWLKAAAFGGVNAWPINESAENASVLITARKG